MQLYRIGEELNLEKIKTTKVVFVGVGSLGCRVIDFLLLPWKEVVLIDPDTLEIENIERHVLSLLEIGQSKVEAMARWLRMRGMTHVTTHDSSAEQVLSNHKDANLIVVTTGGSTVPGWISTWNSYNIPMVVAGIFPNSNAGNISVIPKPADVCFFCFEESFPRQGQEAPKGDAGCIAPEEIPLEAVPGLRWATAHLAAQTAGEILELVQHGHYTELILTTHDWETVMAFPKGGGNLRRAAQSWAQSFRKLGLEPTAQLVGSGRNRVLQIRKGSLVFPVNRVERCPNH